MNEARFLGGHFESCPPKTPLENFHFAIWRGPCGPRHIAGKSFIDRNMGPRLKGFLIRSNLQARVRPSLRLGRRKFFRGFPTPGRGPGGRFYKKAPLAGFCILIGKERALMDFELPGERSSFQSSGSWSWRSEIGLRSFDFPLGSRDPHDHESCVGQT